MHWEGPQVFAKFMNGLFPGPHTVQLHSCLFSLSLNYVVYRYCQLLLPGTLKWDPFKYWQSSPSGFPRQHWVSERSSSRLLLWFSQLGGISPLKLYKHTHFLFFVCLFFNDCYAPEWLPWVLTPSVSFWCLQCLCQAKGRLALQSFPCPLPHPLTWGHLF